MTYRAIARNSASLSARRGQFYGFNCTEVVALVTVNDIQLYQDAIVLLRFMYATGCRVSELCALKWRDLREAALGAGQVTLFGKGSKTRVVIFSAETWKLVRSLRGTTLLARQIRHKFDKNFLPILALDSNNYIDKQIISST
ncbi:MAG TPA: tyrosine-type recombinase/integrase [Kamptonema sp.]|nr:tyrosine-type recombinase/integrase [Kamptonema sp.]